MGYFLVLILVVAVVTVLLIAFFGGKKRPTGQVSPRTDVTYKEPASDEPTPGASDTAGNRTSNEAQNRVPPA